MHMQVELSITLRKRLISLAGKRGPVVQVLTTAHTHAVVCSYHCLAYVHKTVPASNTLCTDLIINTVLSWT